VDVVIPGVKDLIQLNDHLYALEIPAFSEEILKRMEQAVPTVPNWWLPA
jgi:aryl-alcohol dehydrogenase-like predicted oxidoreductase